MGPFEQQVESAYVPPGHHVWTYSAAVHGVRYRGEVAIDPRHKGWDLERYSAQQRAIRTVAEETGVDESEVTGVRVSLKMR